MISASAVGTEKLRVYHRDVLIAEATVRVTNGDFFWSIEPQAGFEPLSVTMLHDESVRDPSWTIDGEDFAAGRRHDDSHDR